MTADSGVFWGTSAWLLFPLQSAAHQFFLVVILCGMLAGASIAFAISNQAFMIFSTPVMLALTTRLASLPDELHLSMAFIALLFWSLCYLIARNLRRSRMQLIEMQELLSERVTQRTAALKAANIRLQAEHSQRAQMEETLQRERDRLAESQKLQAVATLAGGMAHQFNNALSVIMGNVELLQHDYGHLGEIDRNLMPVLRAARQMSQLTDQLLAYAKGGKYKARSTDMNAFVLDTVALIKLSLPAAITIETTLSAPAIYAKMDITQMQMAVSAIVTNSVEASPREGRIQISCRRMRIQDAERSRYGHLPAGDYLALTVADSGTGMDEATRTRIFEPFFTTKFQGRGLGMAAVYGIVQNHGGFVSVVSQAAQGTEVTIYLPECARPETPEADGVPTAAQQETTILLIEDEVMVREVNQAILVRLGYKVVCAPNGREAIDRLKAADASIDLVLLDIKLPDMDGAAIYPIARRHRPNAKIVICSGYALDGPTQALMDQGADGFIHKPFSIQVISEVLDRLLSGPVGT